jgi:hypothetical protein
VSGVARGDRHAYARDGSNSDFRTRWGEVRSSPMCGRLRVGKNFLHVLQDWSMRPCVRPVSAVHMTAGHNALRGSANSARLGGPNMVSSRMLSIIERRPDLMDARAPSKRVNWDSGCKSVSRSDTSPCQVFALSRSAAGGVGCSTETGSDAGKVSLRASSNACSWCVRSRSSRALLSR